MNLFKSDPSLPHEAVAGHGLLDNLMIWGTPETVADDLLALRGKRRAFGTLVTAGMDWGNRELARRPMILLAEKMAPRADAAEPASGKAAE